MLNPKRYSAFKQHYFFYLLLIFTVAVFSVPAKTAPVEVWVNAKLKVYDYPGARWYGKTKNGRFMSEGEAVSNGARPARGVRCN